MQDLLRALQPTAVGDGAFTAVNVPSTERPVVFGGQLLGQSIVAASLLVPGKAVRSVQTTFARAGSVTTDLDVAAEVIHDGRVMGSVAVRITQGDRVLAQSIVLLDAGDPDLVRHGDPMPSVVGPEDVPPSGGESGSDLRIIGGDANFTPEHVDSADLFAWARFPDAPADDVLHRALLAWYTDMLLIGTAMKPHAGVGMTQAHNTISTGVLNHTLTFHEQPDASAWMLLAQHSSYAGGGRTYGTGEVFSQDGVLLASFAQVGMMRAFPEGAGRGMGTLAM